MTVYSVSYAMGTEDNGVCVSYRDLRSAEGCYRELIRDRAVCVILWNSKGEVLRAYRRD